MSVSFIVVQSDSKEVCKISLIHKSSNSELISNKIGLIPKVYGFIAEHLQGKEHTPGQKEIQHFVQNTSRRRDHLTTSKFYKTKEFLDHLNYHPLLKEGSV